MPVNSEVSTTSARLHLQKTLNAQDVQNYVNDLVDKHAVPALSLAIWHKGQLYKAAAGILNAETGVSATPESVFQVGSITKVFTACLIMKLVDQGRINLDAPVNYYLRDFQVVDHKSSVEVTIRQLLNHSSGIEGDFFPPDPCTGGNPIARFVDRCCLLRPVCSPGTHHSYSNTAYTIAGRIIEVVTGTTWFRAMEEHIIQPLGLTHTFVNPAEAIRFRAAMGHMPDLGQTGGWKLAEDCYIPIGQAPAGSTLSMSASDLITFARVHLNQGVAESGQGWLSPKGVADMQRASITLPNNSPLFATDWGLGWFLCNGKKISMLGHNGTTLGQTAMLRLIPEKDCAFAVQANATKAGVLTEIFSDMMADLFDIEFKEEQPRGQSCDSKKIIGIYESIGDRTEIKIVNGKLCAVLEDKMKLVPSSKIFLRAIDEFIYATYSEKGERSLNMTFSDLNEQERPQYLYSGFRLQRRT